MKSIVVKKDVFNKLERALYKSDSTVELIDKIGDAFRVVYEEVPLSIPYKISQVETETLRYSEFYQSGPDLSKFAIEVSGPEYCEYIWRDSKEWVMADQFYEPAEIAKKMCKAPVFNQTPESVKDLNLLLRAGYWKFIPEMFPKFGGNPPGDQLEVVSWDFQNLLIGTKLENIGLVSREEWDNILTREKHWFE